MFDLLSFLTRVLGGFGIPGIEETVLNWLHEKGDDYPDLRERTDALAIWLETTLAESAPNLEPETMRNTLKGIAADVIYGNAGVDPKSWMGGA